MHYKDGTEAKLGDTLRFKSSISAPESPKGYIDVERTGVVTQLYPGSTSCNANIAYPAVQKADDGKLGVVSLLPQTVTLGECELVHRA